MTLASEGETAAPPIHRGGLAAMAVGALGVVYGDIGTSPLYTLKTALQWAGGEATPEVALGMLSLIAWTLIITTSIKYVAVVMRADNDGEGGILALMSLLGIKHGERAGVIALGILGAFVAMVIGYLIGWYHPTANQTPGVIASIIGAIVVLFIWHRVQSARLARR